MKKILLLLIIASTSFQFAYAKVYRIYNNDISFENQLFQIINEIKRVPSSRPITILIDEGYYCLSHVIEISGCNHQLTLIGSKNKSTIISGSIKIEGWELLPSGLWRCRVPNVQVNNYLPDQLYVNGVRAIRSRTPNDGAFILTKGQKEGSVYAAALSESDMNAIAPFSVKDIPLLTIYRKWTASKRYLSGASVKDTTLYFSGIDFPPYNKFEKGNGLIIENTLSGIDKPGEWCVDKEGYIYYLPKDGETIGNTYFRIPILENLIVISSSSRLCIKNIVFEHTSQQVPKEGIEFVQAASKMGAAIEVDDVYGFSFENCEIRNVANYGIWLRKRCSESSITNNYFHDLGAGAMKIGTELNNDSNVISNHIIIDNNIVHHYGQLMEGAVGIGLLNASDCRITHNDIHFGNYSGISIGWVWGFGDSPSKNNEVSYNKISHIGTGLLIDLGGIYTLGRSEGSHVHHNVICDISAVSKGWGIYADEGTTGILFENNVVFRCFSGSFMLHYGSNNIVSNNIFAWGEKSQVHFASDRGDNPLLFTHNIVIMDNGALFSGGAVGSSKFFIRNNCYWSYSQERPKVGQDDIVTWIEQRDTTSVYQNPEFKDPIKGDFRFKNKTTIKALGFKPFDYAKAGVYGKKKWRKLADVKGAGW